MNKPLVSIIINCYNGEKYLNEAIDSIINQTYTNWEVIFWDNCSTDNSAGIILNIKDGRIHYYKSQQHTKLGFARASALNKVSGKYVTFLDCDDMWVRHKLDTQVRLISSGDYGYTYAGHMVIAESGRMLGKYVPREKSDIFFENLVKNFNIDMVTPMIKMTALVENSITFNSDMFGSEEINLFLRLSLKSKGIALNEILGYSRRVDNSLTSRTKDKWHQDMSVTLNQLKSENPALDKTYREQIKYLIFKICYFKAKWLMLEKKHNKAKKVLNECDANFKILIVLRFFVNYPLLWQFIHFLKEKFIFLKNNNTYRNYISR